MEKWLVQAKKADFNGLGEMFSISPIIARIIRNRDLLTAVEYDQYLNGTIKDIPSPFLLKDMEKAVNIINEAIKTKKRIRVIGDYDIDGVCSGYILTDALENMGAIVDFDVPERITDGYGLNERLIQKSFSDGIDLIVTCDNGIAASMQIDYAKNLGMQVIVTDHHEIPFKILNGEKMYEIPNADAVIDQKQVNCSYPFKEVCGAGIALKLVEAIYTRQQKDNSKFEEYKMNFLMKYYVFATIATIGDIVDLRGENRILVKYGLQHIKEIENKGLKALIEENGLSEKEINSYHIGFILGPCINAGGRLDSAKRAFSLFRAKTNEEAKNLAIDLTMLNNERKKMTNDYVKVAKELLQKDESYKNDRVIVLYLKGCHESLAGIIAGRVKEEYYKPTFVLTDSHDCVKGSGRSIESYSMFEELVFANRVASEEEKDIVGGNLLTKFGGHQMAAGLSLDEGNVELFRKIINRNCRLTNEMLVRKVWIDVALPFEYISEGLIEELNLLEPFGKGNEKPVFAEKCEKINKISVRGKNRNVIMLNVSNKSGTSMDCIYFEQEEVFLDSLREKYSQTEIEAAFLGRQNHLKMSILYYPQLDEYYGNKNIRVVIKHYSC